MRSYPKKYDINNSIARPHQLRTFLLVLVILLVSSTAFSQKKTKKELTANDYPLWSYLNTEKLSENGKWISFSVHYQTGTDTLFVKNSKETKTYSFPGASKGEFIAEHWFLMMGSKEELKIVDLTTSGQEIVQGVLKYDLCSDSQNVILFKKINAEKKQLELKNLANGKSIITDDVDRYWYNPKADALIYTTKTQNSTTISLLNLRDKTITAIDSTNKDYEYSDVVWQNNGNSVAFLQKPLDDKEKTIRTCIRYYTIAERKLYTLSPTELDDFPTDRGIISSSSTSLSISEDGKRIFFGLQKMMPPIDTAQTQIWNAQDKFLYPAKVQIENWDRIAKVALWWPMENKFNCITDNEFPKMFLSGNQKYAFLYNPMHYEPQANREPLLDIYILDLQTGKRKLVLQNQLGGQTWTAVSIYENELVYFKDKQWWIYEIESGLHKNLTKELGVNFADEESDRPEEVNPFGNPGWIPEDKTLFIYDQYDIWSIALDGSKAIRLTRGRENKITHRIVSQTKDQSRKMNYDGTYKRQFQWNERLLIKTEALERTGYCYWDNKNGLKPLLDKKMNTSQFVGATKNDSYVYREENYDLPPRLLFKENSNSKEKILFQSNPQHFKFHWGYSKLISYTNSKGTILNGVLFYPANYDTGEKYPMIVHVYEKKSKELYNYVNPSLDNPTGFNITNFTSKGYFVFLPDIVYEIGNPGPSATDCVVSATKKIIDSEAVDSTRVGLTGHSYGGYETDYIITQTNMFAAAVAGAAITDYVSGYLWVTWSFEKPNFWHYEFGQLRIGKSLYEDYQGYLRNSPIYHADKVNTPLLSWAGKQDAQVHYYQSIEFHLALRRLGKINTMLLYPGENHVLMSKKHQNDLTHRIEQWFDYYLKGNQKPEWL